MKLCSHYAKENDVVQYFQKHLKHFKCISSPQKKLKQKKLNVPLALVLIEINK